MDGAGAGGQLHLQPGLPDCRTTRTVALVADLPVRCGSRPPASTGNRYPLAGQSSLCCGVRRDGSGSDVRLALGLGQPHRWIRASDPLDDALDVLLRHR